MSVQLSLMNKLSFFTVLEFKTDIISILKS